MRYSIAQTQILMTACLCLLGTKPLSASKNRRAPLEAGLVALPAAVPGAAPAPPAPGAHRSREWVPGRVVDHAYIPAHLHRLYIPAHAVIVGLVHRGIYRSHYGGFGVGVDVGGQGAGHGYHVLF